MEEGDNGQLACLLDELDVASIERLRHEDQVVVVGCYHLAQLFLLAFRHTDAQTQLGHE